VNTSADALRRIEQGFQFIAVGSELKLMLEGASALVQAVNPEKAAGELARY
jgi:4-hydroxy-2-oxoheptanedioate aldolase